MSKYKTFIIFGTIIGLCFVGLVSVSVLQKKPNLVIEIAPNGALITVDGKKISKTTLFIAPGKHSLVARLDGFAGNEQTFTTETGKTTNLIVLLDPNTPAGEKYLRENPREQFNREALGGKLSAQLSTATTAKNPILASLPFIDRLFRVDYGASVKNPKDPLAVALFVTFYSEQGKQEALEWLQFKGVDTTTAEVLFINALDVSAE